MASNQNELLFTCSRCQHDIDLKSKTLKCLHSYCLSCFDREFSGQRTGKRKCLKCQEPFELDQLIRLPFWENSLMQKQLESAEWKCNTCLKGSITIWCNDCQKCLCQNCRCTSPECNSIQLDEIGKDDAIKRIKTQCSLHKKQNKTSIVCNCDTSTQKFITREEVSKQMKNGHDLCQEISDFEKTLKESNETMKRYINELETEYILKRDEIQQQYKEIETILKKGMEKLCHDMEKLEKVQIKKWQDSIKENENMLNKMEIWRKKVQYLINSDQEDIDIVCGVRSLELNLLPQLNKSNNPLEKYALEVKFPDSWTNLSELKGKSICSVSLNEKKIDLKRKWMLPNLNLYISSIYVSHPDNHIFFCDCENNSIIEYTELGDFHYECKLTNDYSPSEICSINTNVLFVLCSEQNKILTLERKAEEPFLEMKKTIPLDNISFSSSLCNTDEKIFICDLNFQVNSYKKDMKPFKIIKKNELDIKGCPIIRINLSCGNIWASIINSSSLCCFHQNGKIIESITIKRKIFDFCVYRNDIIYCNFEGLFLLSVKKVLYTFKKKPENRPTISAIGKKIYLCCKIDGKYSIEIFKIL